MKFILLIFILVFSLTSFADDFQSPDIIVKTKLTSDWSGLLIAKIRKLLKNYEIQDPFKQNFVEPIVVNDSLIEEYLDSDARELMQDLGKAIGLELLKSKTNVTIEGLAYDIQNLSTDIKATADKKDSFLVAADLSAGKVKLSADKITLSLNLPGDDKPVLKIQVINPLISASDSRLINFFTQLELISKTDAYVLDLQQLNFQRLLSRLVSNPSSIKISFDRIDIPKISLKIGSKKVNFDPAKIEDLPISNEDAFKSLLIGQASSILSEELSQTLSGILKRYSIAKDYWFTADPLAMQFGIVDIRRDVERNDIEVRLDGNFCTIQNQSLHGKDCINSNEVRPPVSRLTAIHHEKSHNEIKNIFRAGSANLLLSVSEDYVNKILVSTMEAGLWNDVFKDAGIQLGSQQLFIRLDEKGETGTLYMDVLYTPTRAERVIIGEKTIRFPLVIKAGIRIETNDQDNIPVFIIKVNSVDLSDKTLLNGVPQLNLESNVYKLRFKKKILDKIRTEVQPLLNKDMIELPYPELRGLGIEQAHFISDGQGRMNAYMLIKKERAKI